MNTIEQDLCADPIRDDAESLPIIEAPAEALQLALLPRPAPRLGLLYSLLFHVVVLVALTSLPQILAPPPILRNRGSDVSLATYEPITFDGLPSIADSGGGQNGGIAGGSPGSVGGQPTQAGPPKPASKAASPPPATLPKVVYAGPQEIISNPANATNNVQMIRRPDLFAPPKLKFAVRLKSMVLTPASPAPVLLAPPEPAKRERTVTELAAVPAPTVERPALPVRVPQEKRQQVEAREAPKLAFKQQAAPTPDVRSRALPVLAEDSQGSGTKAAVVINAVSVPPDSPTDVPDAELEGNFAVMPLRKVQLAKLSSEPGVAAGPALNEGGGSGNGVADNGTGGGTNSRGSGGVPRGTGSGSGTGGTGTGTGGGTGSGTSARGEGTGSGAGGTGSGAGSGVGSGKGSGRGSGPGIGTGSGTGAGGTGTGTGSGSGAGSGRGSTKLPGIVIVGGSSGGRSHFPARTASPPPRRSYEMTIISGGSSGGATRELGVFSRDETVYTVYINMADVGGREYSMQYALAKPAQADGGLLSPPFAIKKVAAIASPEQFNSSSQAGPVFVTAIVDEHGRLGELRAVHPEDPRTSLAIASFSGWQFEPAELNGKAVATKVLIGITLIPANAPGVAK